MTGFPLLMCTIGGIVVRLALFRTSIPDWISSQTEIVTPLTSWERG